MNLADFHEAVSPLATEGYYLALWFGFSAPVVEINRLPGPWVNYYASQGFIGYDPVAIWCLREEGVCRWSDLESLDEAGVFDQASRFGLRHGLCLSSLVQTGRCFASFARYDRAFTDEEIKTLQMAFSEIVNTPAHALLSIAEREALGLMRDGMRYAEAADSLGITQSAVKQRLRSARIKLGGKTLVEAVALASSHRLI